jgi:hypothetical protein
VLLLLLGVSHLRNVAVHMNHDKWEIVDLCQRGFCVTDATVAELTKKVHEEKRVQEYGDVTAVIQLLDNSMFQVGGLEEGHANCHVPTEMVPTTWRVPCMLLTSQQYGIGVYISV